MKPDTTLSQTISGVRWIGRFPVKDQLVLANFVDSVLLLDDTVVATAILAQLEGIVPIKDRVALYAEREVAEAEIFPSQSVLDQVGKSHRRAVGKYGPPAIKPKRGSRRVGSEGFVAFIISQAVKQNSRFLNHPGPDRFRKPGKKGVRHIVIVTDIIGSGTRIRKQLDAFWRVPTIASWHSRKWVRFHVVAAVTTVSGKSAVEMHKTKPVVHATYVAPTLSSHRPKGEAELWTDLATKWGPIEEPLGYQNGGVLVAFRYGFPNNAPRIFWDKESERRPLFDGPAPFDTIVAFQTENSGMPRLLRAFRALTRWLDAQVKRLLPSPERARKIIFLKSLRGRWRPGKEIEIAQRTGLTVSEVMKFRADTQGHGWIGADGRITDLGRKLLRAASAQEREKPVVRTNSVAYYPKRLRAP